METKVDNLDIDKLKTVPTALSKPSNIVDNVFYMINPLLKLLLLIIHYQVVVDLSLKHTMTWIKKILRNRLKMLKKRYPVLWDGQKD